MESYNLTNSTQLNKLVKVANIIESSILFLGFISNLLCIIVFGVINRTFKTNGQMFKYLLMKSICDFIYILDFLLNQYYDISSYEIRYSIWFQIYFVYLFHFFGHLIEIYSIYFEVLATIDCFLSIENKYKFLLTNKTFYLCTTFNFLFFFLFYSGKFLVYKIVPIGMYYTTIKTYLYFNYFYKTLTMLYLIVRDIIGISLLIFFNILIFLKLKKISETKNNLKNNKAFKKVITAQQNKVKMIYLSCINYILFHVPSFINNVYGKYILTQFWFIFEMFKNDILILSYTTPFFIYILFNRIFKNYFLRILLGVKTFFNL
jgi:hypothetical protein